jgi:hypothetical protein
MLEDGRELVTGWDGALSSFFAQVFDPSVEDDEDDLVIDIGAGVKFGEGGSLVKDTILLTGELASRLATHGIELTQEELAQLHQDKVERGSDVTPFQQAQMDRMDGILGIDR